MVHVCSIYILQHKHVHHYVTTGGDCAEVMTGGHIQVDLLIFSFCVCGWFRLIQVVPVVKLGNVHVTTS